MARKKEKPIEKQLNDWINKWLEEKARCASDIAIIINENKEYDSQKDLNDITIGDELEIRLLPHIPKIKRNEQYYEIQLRLPLEKLTLKQIDGLKKELDIIKELQGLDFKEGLAYIIQIFMIFHDYLRLQNNMATIYPINEIDRIDLLSYKLLKRDYEKEIELYSNKMMINLDEILEFWTESELSYSEDIFRVIIATAPFSKPSKNHEGRIHYFTIPPMWKSCTDEWQFFVKIIYNIDDFKNFPKYLLAFKMAEYQITKQKKEKNDEQEIIEDFKAIEDEEKISEVKISSDGKSVSIDNKHQFPKEVVGLVFIDCIPEDWLEYIRTTHSDEEIKMFNKIADPKQYTGVLKDEWEQFEHNCELIRGIKTPENIPTRIITATQYGRDQQNLGYHPEDMKVWAKMQARMMNNVEDAKQIITDKSGHSIQLSEPELIINAVKELIEIYRNKLK